MATDKAATPMDGAPASLSIHALTHELQQAHGLRPDSDFKAYRQYLSRRLRRVRVGAGFKFGKGRGFIKRDLTPEDVAAHPELLGRPTLVSAPFTRPPPLE